MGVTVKSKDFSMGLGYGGFLRLRKKVAELTGKEIGEHYAYLEKGMFSINESERKKFLDQYNKKTTELAKTHKIPIGILEFLYSSDCNGSLAPSKCKQIYKIIKNYDDNILYGYAGKPDCAKFKDFKAIIKNCIDNKCSMKWC